MQQHKVQSGETLSRIASHYSVSLEALKAQNPIIKDVNHIEAGWNLSIPKAAAPTTPLPPAHSANDDSSDDVECSDCSLEYVGLVQLTENDEQVFALTKTQMKELEYETYLLNEPLAELAEAEEGDQSKILQAREKAWNRLKELGALPKPEQTTTARELLADYEARWRRDLERLEHQRRRKKRITYEIENLRNQILIPGRERNFQDPKDRLSLQFFTLYCGELESTLDAVDSRIKAHEEATQNSEQDLTRMSEHLKLLRAALEAEIEYRVAEQSGKPESQLIQLLYEAEELKKATLWPNYISEKAVRELTSQTIRLRKLDDELIPYMDYVIEYSAKVSPAVWLATLIANDEVQAHKRLQEERRSLMTSTEKKLRDLAEIGSPIGVSSRIDTIESPLAGFMKRYPLVEVKHTGTGGYRYMRREVADQLKKNWKPLKTSDVRAAMNAGEFKRAWGQAKDALKTSKELSLKLGEWKSKDDNFFNRLEVELLKKEAATEDGRFSASAEAQMFRFAAQSGLAATYDHEKGEAYIGGKLQGAYSLMQGEAVLKAQIPSEQGSGLVLKYESHDGTQKELHCGYFRADAEYRIRGFAGACASLAAQAKISSAPGSVGISGNTNGEAFAGASLNNEATFGVKWKGAYQKVIATQSKASETNSVTAKQAEADAEFRSLLDVKPELAVSAGIGVGFDFKIELKESKLVAYINGHLVLGPGGGGGIAAELNSSQIWELVKFVRWSLERSDFRFLDWIDSAAFEYLSFLLRLFAVSDERFVDVANKSFVSLSETWAAITTADTRVRDTALQVLEKKDLDVLTPTAKADLLDILTEDNRSLFGFGNPHSEIAMEASIKILETVHSHRELVEVLKRTGMGSRKGHIERLKRNYYRIIARQLLQSKQATRTEFWLQKIVS
ncbi:hypothetical protein GCM10011533_05070 [Streptosporangium jomthongense]|uniref:LysM peptidoglycan-binding domain-containing protein n=1 Tax=Marinobacter aromaticivorans TaxID=1494078 RepID=A0ABW2IRN0_9GAMM|nr:LysM peptidoglycan-binding domain-containing protein [Marinobacter aromaticivorans]GGE55585.1 hypothetical protein GCM10011533_05070 [Streptosporangium jomthongense]